MGRSVAAVQLWPAVEAFATCIVGRCSVIRRVTGSDSRCCCRCCYSTANRSYRLVMFVTNERKQIWLKADFQMRGVGHFQLIRSRILCQWTYSKESIFFHLDWNRVHYLANNKTKQSYTGVLQFEVDNGI